MPAVASPHVSVPKSRRLKVLAGAGLAVLALAGPALALCPICNASVRLDANLAGCLAKRLDGEIARLKSEGRGFIIVNLSDCGSAAPTRSALPTDPGKAEPLDSSFVADGTSLQCLSQAIAEHAGPMDPSYLFDLARICGP